MFKVLQVCNVGQIVGGTAACAWTIAASLKACSHTVAFLGRIAEETQRAFSSSHVLKWDQISAEQILSLDADIVILHNAGASRVCSRWDSFLKLSIGQRPIVVNYLHSKISPARADLYWCCSRWLAKRLGMDAENVLYQGVPCPKKPDSFSGYPSRLLRRELIVGRICTPRLSKWSSNLPSFYANLSEQFPTIFWEFVGCPLEMQESLRCACLGRVSFYDACWTARHRFWNWDVLLYHNPQVVESFGRTCAEAMRAGCIPVLDAQGGFCEQITKGTGFLCRQEAEFSSALKELSDLSCRRQRSRSCLRSAEERFSLDQMRQQILQRLASTI